MTAITLDAMSNVLPVESRLQLASPTPKQLEIAAAPSSSTEHAVAMRAFFAAVLPPILGILLLIGVWHVATMKGGADPVASRPGRPPPSFSADPFYRNGPNDQGIGWNILASLERVGIGFGIAALIGIPAGFLLGRFALLSSTGQSLDQLAASGFAAGLAADRSPGLQARRPRRDLDDLHLLDLADDHEHRAGRASACRRTISNVARVLNLSEWKIVTKILFPSGAALHAHRHPPVDGHRLAGHRRGGNAHRRRRASASGSGTSGTTSRSNTSSSPSS